MISVVLVASIALAVVLGYKTKINTGFFCIAFAYLIGCFALGMKTKELIACWAHQHHVRHPVRIPVLQFCSHQRNP